jgi:hypothetical protein
MRITAHRIEATDRSPATVSSRKSHGCGTFRALHRSGPFIAQSRLGRATKASPSKERWQAMLMTIAVILLIMWFLGMVTAHTLGGFIHILLLLAIVTVLIRVIQGRNPV